ncbi:hypothetical protein ACJRO7_000297 [Eucalyptus globulus]|uniref:Uncharacterized protein n=1 Tax=Eucalyptus globulus TaxID=34317 RepID=A0ABD3LM53_EUCGL
MRPALFLCNSRSLSFYFLLSPFVLLTSCFLKKVHQNLNKLRPYSFFSNARSQYSFWEVVGHGREEIAESFEREEEGAAELRLWREPGGEKTRDRRSEGSSAKEKGEISPSEQSESHLLETKKKKDEEGETEKMRVSGAVGTVKVVCVTGASGYIALWLIKLLLQVRLHCKGLGPQSE